MSSAIFSHRMFALLPLLLSTFAVSDVVNGFVAGRITATNGRILPYRLYLPSVPDGGKLPLLVHFHGAGSRGVNNTAQLGQARRFATAGFQKTFPCFVLAPQCPAEERWVDLDWRKIEHTMPQQPTWQMAAALALVEKLLQELPIDPTRVYVNGQSMGGYATWDAISRRPEMFAAAVPVCGGGDVKQVANLKKIPVWAFHGALDKTVPPENSRRMVTALQLAGATVQYTEYPGVAHDAWNHAYDEPGLQEWLFKQRRE